MQRPPGSGNKKKMMSALFSDIMFFLFSMALPVGKVLYNATEEENKAKGSTSSSVRQKPQGSK